MLDTIHEQKKTISNKLQRLSVLTEASEMTAQDTVGALVSLDTNLTLAQRDKFLEKLSPHMAYAREQLRHASLQSSDLMPTDREFQNEAKTERQDHNSMMMTSMMTRGFPRGQAPGRGGRGARGGRGGGKASQPYHPAQHHQPQWQQPQWQQPQWQQPFRGGRGAGRGSTRGRGGSRGGGRGADRGNYTSKDVSSYGDKSKSK